MNPNQANSRGVFSPNTLMTSTILDTFSDITTLCVSMTTLEEQLGKMKADIQSSFCNIEGEINCVEQVIQSLKTQIGEVASRLVLSPQTHTPRPAYSSELGGNDVITEYSTKYRVGPGDVSGYSRQDRHYTSSVHSLQPVPSAQTMEFFEDLVDYYKRERSGTRRACPEQSQSGEVPVPSLETLTFLADLTSYFRDLTHSHVTETADVVPSVTSQALSLLSHLKQEVEAGNNLNKVDVQLQDSKVMRLAVVPRLEKVTSGFVKRKRKYDDVSKYCCSCHPRSSGRCMRCHGPSGVCTNCRNKRCRFKAQNAQAATKPSIPEVSVSPTKPPANDLKNKPSLAPTSPKTPASATERHPEASPASGATFSAAEEPLMESGGAVYSSSSEVVSSIDRELEERDLDMISVLEDGSGDTAVWI